MKRTLFAAVLAGTIALAAVTSASAQDDMMDPAMDAGADIGLDCCCCNSGSWIFAAEATFFKFHHADGVQDGEGEEANFDYEIDVPRLTVGYVGCDGMGARVRYWSYDENVDSENDEDVRVDTYYIDFEVFQTVELDCCTTLEASMGIRYNEFDYFADSDVGPALGENFDGFGGIVGIEVTRSVGCNWDVYARLREIIMTGDSIFQDAGDDEDRNDTIRPVTEIALGINYHSCNWSINAGYEWHNWANYANIEEAVEISGDVGFSGWVFGAELSY